MHLDNTPDSTGPADVPPGLPTLPELGRENTYYGKVAHKAEKKGDVRTHAAYKVAQYITLGKEANNWPDKVKYFRHAIEKHAKPRPPIDDAVWAFYQQLQDWVRQEAGVEAMRTVQIEDEFFTARVNQNEARFRIVSDAARFFRDILGAGDKPNWFTDADFEKLRRYQLKWANAGSPGR
jgi:hypothetical protein